MGMRSRLWLGVPEGSVMRGGSECALLDCSVNLSPPMGCVNEIQSTSSVYEAGTVDCGFWATESPKWEVWAVESVEGVRGARVWRV